MSEDPNLKHCLCGNYIQTACFSHLKNSLQLSLGHGTRQLNTVRLTSSITRTSRCAITVAIYLSIHVYYHMWVTPFVWDTHTICHGYHCCCVLCEIYAEEEKSEHRIWLPDMIHQGLRHKKNSGKIRKSHDQQYSCCQHTKKSCGTCAEYKRKCLRKGCTSQGEN